VLRLSKKTDYALMAMRHLAAKGGQSSASVREIAASYGIPGELLAKVLQNLARKRLLVSQQGINGGYHLARPAEAISVADVIQAVDGRLSLTACTEQDDRCEQYATCSVRDPLWRIRTEILKALTTCTLADLIGTETPAVEAPLKIVAGPRTGIDEAATC
jgi:Rrf2 family protein